MFSVTLSSLMTYSLPLLSIFMVYSHCRNWVTQTWLSFEKWFERTIYYISYLSTWKKIYINWSRTGNVTWIPSLILHIEPNLHNLWFTSVCILHGRHLTCITFSWHECLIHNLFCLTSFHVNLFHPFSSMKSLHPYFCTDMTCPPIKLKHNNSILIWNIGFPFPNWNFCCWLKTEKNHLLKE